jgi:hypothetical protein
MTETTYNKMKKSNKRSVFVFLFLSLLLITSLSRAEILTGKVSSIHGDVVELNLGSEKGIRSGDSGRVYYNITIGGKEKSIFIAKFRITHLSEKSSMAQIEDSTGEVKAGYSVEVVVKESVRLEVKSEPSGAKVTIDGKEAGNTPLSLSDIKTGRHQIRVVKEGYESYEVSVETGVGRKEVMANLKKVVRKGELLIRTVPTEATVYLNEKSVGTSPYEGIGLSPGLYKVRVVKEGYEPWEKDIAVEAGKKAEVIAKLEEIDWSKRPCNAPVWTVGDQWTYKPARGGHGIREIVEVKEDLFIMKTSESENLRAYDKTTMNLKFLVDKSGKQVSVSNVFRKVLDFPMFVGKKWKDTVTARTATKREVTFENEFQIEGVEEVTTPAGVFKAFKIYQKQSNTVPPGRSGWARYWYSPIAKNTVKIEVEKSPYWAGVPWPQDSELISYELK